MSTIKYYLHASSMLSSLLTDSSKREQKLASVFFGKSVQPFHDGGRYHIETSPLICSTASVMKGLNKNIRLTG